MFSKSHLLQRRQNPLNMHQNACKTRKECSAEHMCHLHLFIESMTDTDIRTDRRRTKKKGIPKCLPCYAGWHKKVLAHFAVDNIHSLLLVHIIKTMFQKPTIVCYLIGIIINPLQLAKQAVKPGAVSWKPSLANILRHLTYVNVIIVIHLPTIG